VSSLVPLNLITPVEGISVLLVEKTGVLGGAMGGILLL